MSYISDLKNNLDPTQVKSNFRPDGTEFAQLFTNIINYILVPIISISAVLSLIYGGYLYITAGANAEQAEKGKRVIMYTVIALVVAILSYVIYVFVTEKMW
ncbi:hypothetical protein KBB60_01900 [Patescibacteria group bacterium]|jgi:membrane-anchored glycerophosphoryl diester phosphodiesterase (GDPDase)|nr:hypothetical protein [Patescibacteria group bacterium]